MQRYIIAIIVLLVLVGCINEREVSEHYKQRMVIEGRIENGRAAIVTLSLNLAYNDEYDSESFREMVVRWAKVTVADDEGNEEVLTGRSNKDYPTQYIYTGSSLKGRVGHTYTLVVEYSGRKWASTTTIPSEISLEDITITHFQDSLYSITAVLPPIPTPCSIDCSLNGSTYYAPTLVGVYDASTTPRRITINRPLHNFSREDYLTYFSSDDVVKLRLNSLGDFAFDYWCEWENSIINLQNPIFPAIGNLPTNISDEGLGIWAGYGTTYYDLGPIAF
jgi:hypothetical protein